VLKDYNGIYASHIRSESAGWIESVEEVVEICEKNQIPGIVHHLKTKAKDSKELVAKVLKTLSDARERGVDVVFEQYPYEASATGLDVVLSSWMHEGGKEAILERLRDKQRFEEFRQSIRADYGWKNDEEEWIGAKNMLVVSAEGHPEYTGRFIDEIARDLGKEPVETVFHILLDTDLHAGGAFFGIKEEDICTILQHPLGMVGSDSDDVKVGETTHPRTNGTFPRVLKSYVLDKGIISMETAIYKMTGFPAARFGLHQRGLIRQGFFADLVLINPETLADNATYLEPFTAPEGIDLVMINGVIALEDGKPTGEMAGTVLRSCS
jgi:N-acyl-D-aspartate/D-glutamate deacylase